MMLAWSISAAVSVAPAALGQAAAAPASADTPAATGGGVLEVVVPSTAFTLRLVPVPGDESKGIKPFYMLATELTFDAFDVFVYSLDEEAGEPALDAVSRPSKPYLPPDRGFGHEGYAAISLSFVSAREFCVWLSARTGKSFRLATEDEWEHAARGGAPADQLYFFGKNAAELGDYAWFAGNSGGTPHRAGSKKPNGYGLYDMLGNVQEWVIGRDGKPITKGGSFRDGPERMTIEHAEQQQRSWNASDPQIPKSRWWLADGLMVGFRIVCEMPEGGAAKP